MRKNTTTSLSDWQNQLQPSDHLQQQQLRTSTVQPHVAHQLASNFFTDLKSLAHYGNLNSITDALWNLRDYLLEDTLQIRTRFVGQSLECL